MIAGKGTDDVTSDPTHARYTADIDIQIDRYINDRSQERNKQIYRYVGDI